MIISGQKPSIVIIGSSNTDMVVKTDRIPKPGETILGGSFFMNAGGKGANQAVAAARLGGAVTFIANVGNDFFGREAIQLLQKEGIDTNFITIDINHPSGVALITVDKKGENNIVVASGANASFNAEILAAAKGVIEHASILLMQLEIPMETTYYAASAASAREATIILNPAPACALPPSLLSFISIITPNQSEAEMLSGVTITDIASAHQAASIILDKGVKTVIITLGSKGALVVQERFSKLIPTPKVEAVDTTAAGDVFNGALAVALAEGFSITEAVAFGCHAAAISVTRLGAQASAPHRYEITHVDSVAGI
ncbi:MAG: ribokinase [Flavisolibacter sp.]